jgi:malonate transporter
VSGVAAGFFAIVSIIGLGYLLARRGTLGDSGAEVLARVAFSVAAPAMLFVTLAGTELSVVFSPVLAVTALVAVLMGAIFAAVSVVRGWGAGRTVVGALCASYVNAVNLGVPIAAYVLGDASLVVPVLMFQMLIVMPLGLTALDFTTADVDTSLARRLTAPLRNPVLVACLLGVLVAASGVTVPGWLLDPVALVGDMAVPVMLIVYGHSLRGSRVLGRGGDRGPVLLAAALKLIGAPVASWLLGGWVFGLDGATLLAVVVLAGLPAAQNLFTYALRYGTAVDLCRQAILVETVLSMPVLLTLALLFA